MSKLYIKKTGKLVTEEMIKECLKESGIEVPYIYSDCFNECKCKEWKKEKGDMTINFFKPHITNENFRERIKVAIAVLRTGATELMKAYEIGYKASENILGFLLVDSQMIESPEIFVFANEILDSGNKLSEILKHELLHLKEKKHCEDKNCLFFNCITESSVFCSNCQTKYNNLIEEINKLGKEHEEK